MCHRRIGRMHPVLFDFGFFQLRTYGVLVTLGVLLGVWFAAKHLKRFSIPENKVWDVAVYAMVFGIVGARLAFVIQHWSYFQNHIDEIFKVWEGGLTFYGVLLGVIPILWAIWRYRWNFWAVLDATIPGVTLGIAIGRWGCFFNGCCYGKPTDLPWGVVYPEYSEPHLQFGGVPVHPSQIYESVGDAILFLLYLYLLKRYGQRRPGVVGAVALIFTPLVRFLVDFTRAYEPNAYILGLTFNQWIAVGLMLSGLLLLTYRLKATPSEG